MKSAEPVQESRIIQNTFYIQFAAFIMSELTHMLGSWFMMLSAGILSYWFGANAVWYAFLSTQLLMFLYYGMVVRFNSIRMDLMHCRLWDRVLLLPGSFDVREEDRLDICIDSMSQVTDISEAVWDFCESHGCDRRRKYYMSLAVEEITKNIIQYGFHRKILSRNSIDIRVMRKEDDYILRIRDNCLIFDPQKQDKLLEHEDPMRHIGLRMIFQLGGEIRYTCILKLNNLWIKF